MSAPARSGSKLTPWCRKHRHPEVQAPSVSGPPSPRGTSALGFGSAVTQRYKRRRLRERPSSRGTSTVGVGSTVILRCERSEPRRMWGWSSPATTACNLRHAIPIALDKCQLLGPAPPLDLPLGGDGVGDLFEALRPDELHGPAVECVPGKGAAFMLGNALVQWAAGRADIKGTIGTAQHVGEGHGRTLAISRTLTMSGRLSRFKGRSCVLRGSPVGQHLSMT